MSEYRAIYKCRLCGEEFENGRIENENIVDSCVMAISILGDTQKVRTSMSLHEHYVHYCKNGSMGMADFLGFRKVEE